MIAVQISMFTVPMAEWLLIDRKKGQILWNSIFELQVTIWILFLWQKEISQSVQGTVKPLFQAAKKASFGSMIL